ncbi:hypothetical protein SAMN04488541_10282 [Thermoflexibacter ruber]|uniref:Uncharacterized protein n=1 Tax=Thermoflexibacter ruber TaxID=1003 RepID=A0A1I2I5A2_9BACT|nr:hypothetical protein SAMN04488541_10282 [Thermoflexibacter ruber]
MNFIKIIIPLNLFKARKLGLFLSQKSISYQYFTPIELIQTTSKIYC